MNSSQLETSSWEVEALMPHPITRLSVMEGRTLAIGAFNTKLDDNFNIAAESEEEAERVRRGMQEVEHV